MPPGDRVLDQGTKGFGSGGRRCDAAGALRKESVAKPEGSGALVGGRPPVVERERVGSDDLVGEGERRRTRRVVASERERCYRSSDGESGEHDDDEQHSAEPHAGRGRTTGSRLDPGIVRSGLAASTYPLLSSRSRGGGGAFCRAAGGLACPARTPRAST